MIEQELKKLTFWNKLSLAEQDQIRGLLNGYIKFMTNETKKEERKSQCCNAEIYCPCDELNCKCPINLWKCIKCRNWLKDKPISSPHIPTEDCTSCREDMMCHKHIYEIVNSRTGEEKEFRGLSIIKDENKKDGEWELKNVPRVSTGEDWEKEVDKLFTSNRNAHIGIPENEGCVHIISKIALKDLKSLVSLLLLSKEKEVKQRLLAEMMFYHQNERGASMIGMLNIIQSSLLSNNQSNNEKE